MVAQAPQSKTRIYVDKGRQKLSIKTTSSTKYQVLFNETTF